MPGNTFGQLFRIATFGESHGGAVGAVVDGCPPGLKITKEDIQKDLDRRKPGQSQISSPRKEQDEIHILSGVFEEHTTGTPILLLAYNKDAKPDDYLKLKDLYRPGHADYTYIKKYGLRDWHGSGRASARETLARVAAGAIAKKYLKEKLNVEFCSYVEQVGDIKADIDINNVNTLDIERNIVRCPDQKKAKAMIALIESIKKDGDSVGGIIKGIIRNIPAGLGEPVFEKFPASLGQAMLSINAVKGFEIGSGFSGATKKGSQNNDEFVSDKKGKARTRTNNAGGVLGGITTGEDVYFKVAFKPVSTINKEQRTLNTNNEKILLKASGRHDPCVLPRAVPIVDAMAAITTMDHFLRHKAQNL